jgi:hypothetical protein
MKTVSPSKPSGTYSGRLAFDPETDFHTDPDGNPVVTEDGGKTWRYATDDDVSHVEQYHERFATVDSTDNRLAELMVEHGRDRANEIMRGTDPHHFEVQPGDDHHDADARNKTKLASLPRKKAGTTTGHTEAWKDA